jgi:plasmid stabilization system protein ParE
VRIPAGLGYLFSGAGGTTGSRSRDVAIKAARLFHRDRWRYSIARRRRDVDSIPLDRPIFFLGAQGAGETLVGRCLRRHPAVVSMSGGSDSWTGIDELGIVRNRMAHLPRSLWGCKHRTDLEHPVYGADHNSVYACDELLPLYRATADDANEDDARRYRRLLREHIAVYARDPSRARFFDKTHTNTLKIPLISALIEGSEPVFVLVVRNPYTWAYRAIRRKPPSWRVDVSAEDQLRLVAEHWANSCRVALDDGAEAPGFAVLRFEDFLADPAQVIHALCNVVGLDFDERTMIPQPGHTFPFETLPSDRKWYPLIPDPWLEHVSERDAEIIEDRCSGLAKVFGYTRDGTATPSPEVGLLGAKV